MNFKKRNISKKNPSKGHLSTCKFNENFFFFLFNNVQIDVGNTLVQIHAPGSKHRYLRTQSAGGASKQLATLIQFRCRLIRSASILNLVVKVVVISFTVAPVNTSKIKGQFFSIFLDELFSLDSEAIACRPICSI